MRALTVLLLLVGALPVGACTHNKPEEGEQERAPLPTGIVEINAAGRTIRVKVEIAETPAHRERGLMFRKHLAAYEGMLFVFDQQVVQSFWMKNTYIPLDMLFIDRGHKVVGVVHEAEPLTLTSRSVSAPSSYVLELPGGFARKHGIDAGATIAIQRDKVAR